MLTCAEVGTYGELYVSMVHKSHDNRVTSFCLLWAFDVERSDLYPIKPKVYLTDVFYMDGI